MDTFTEHTANSNNSQATVQKYEVAICATAHGVASRQHFRTVIILVGCDTLKKKGVSGAPLGASRGCPPGPTAHPCRGSRTRTGAARHPRGCFVPRTRAAGFTIRLNAFEVMSIVPSDVFGRVSDVPMRFFPLQGATLSGFQRLATGKRKAEHRHQHKSVSGV